MKTKKWVITTLAIFIVAVGFATETPKMNVIPVEDEKALVAFYSANPTVFELTIENAEGSVVYYKKSQKPLCEYKKIFDFSDLGNGNYNVCLNYGTQSVSRKIHVLENKIEVGSPTRLYEPYFSFENDKLSISHLNIAQKNVYMNVYKDGEYYSSNKLGKEMCIQKRFNLSKLEKGDYEVIVTDTFKDHKFMVHK